MTIFDMAQPSIRIHQGLEDDSCKLWNEFECCISSSTIRYLYPLLYEVEDEEDGKNGENNLNDSIRRRSDGEEDGDVDVDADPDPDAEDETDDDPGCGR